MSTKTSLYFIERDETDNHASLHIYTDCFDREDDVLIKVWMQGEEENTEETIMIPKDLWDRFVAQITKEQVSALQAENMELRGDRVAHRATKSVLNKAHEHIAELEVEISSFEDDIIRFNDICVKKTRGLAKQLETAVDALERARVNSYPGLAVKEGKLLNLIYKDTTKTLVAIRKE